MYNPHAAPDNDRKKHPEMCTYDVSREFDLPKFNAEENFEPRLGLVTGGKVYVENNSDRFGMQVRPCKPILSTPAPGFYDKDFSGFGFCVGPNVACSIDGQMSYPKPPVNGYISNLPVKRGIPDKVD